MWPRSKRISITYSKSIMMRSYIFKEAEVSWTSLRRRGRANPVLIMGGVPNAAVGVGGMEEPSVELSKPFARRDASKSEAPP